MAREGKTVETSARAIEIYNFELDYGSFDTDNTIDFSVDCSKGTYIRSLAHDFGKALKSGAHLSRLRRTAIGAFKVEDARTPDALKEELCS
jgi:tRNA pseudouridine55 synthase